MDRQYKCECSECGKKLEDPKDNPVYVAPLDKYFCDDKCWNIFRKKDVSNERNA